MDDIFNNIDDYNPTRKRKILIVFDDVIADIMANKEFQAIIKELFINIYYICLLYLLYLLHIILFFCSKTGQIKFYALLNNEDSQ